MTRELNPPARGAHAVPVNTATGPTGSPPEVVKLPLATTRPLGRANTSFTGPSNPAPSADQVVPSQIAMLLPGVWNWPAATMSPLGRMAMSLTSPTGSPALMPAPRVDQAEPFQIAMREAGAPSAVVNWPPTTNVPVDVRFSIVTQAALNPDPK